MLVRLVVALSFSLGAMPGVCDASTVALAGGSPVDYGAGWASIEYRAAPGEANRVSLTTVDQMTLRVSDAGATIAAGPSCRSIDADTAECSVEGSGLNGLIAARVIAGDMDDIVESDGPGLSADGGAGNDLLQSSSIVAGVLDGGGGRDTLLGGKNRDTLIDGDASGSADSDTLDGREQGAIVDYSSRTAPVQVDLRDPGGDGEDGEADVLRNVSGAVGGRGADVLRGDQLENNLSGGPGADRIRGLGGGDFVSGGDGDDRLDGHTGDDFLRGQGGRDTIRGGAGLDVIDGGSGRDVLSGGAGNDFLRSGSSRCGRGRDSVRPTRRDYLAPDCEAADFELRKRRDEFADAKQMSVKPYPVSVRRSGVTFEIGCPYLSLDGESEPVTMRGRIRLLTSGGATIGSARLPSTCRRRTYGTEPATARVRVPVDARRHRNRLVAVAFTGRNVPPAPWRIRLRSR